MNPYKEAGKNQLKTPDNKMIYLSVPGDIIVTLNILAALTRKMLALHMFRQVHSCMNLANPVV